VVPSHVLITNGRYYDKECVEIAQYSDWLWTGPPGFDSLEG